MNTRRILEIWRAHISFFTIIPCKSSIDISQALEFVDLAVITVSPVILATCCIPIYLLYKFRFTSNLILLSALSYSLILILTGMLHIDGLTDVVDALFAPREKRLEVLKDPRIGSIGASVLFIVLTLGIISIITSKSIRDIIVKLVLSELYSRLSCSKCSRMGKPLHEGLGSIVHRGATRRKFLITVPVIVNVAVSIVLLGLLNTVIYLVTCTITVLILLKIPIRVLGGISGDVLGYSIEIGRHISLIILSFIL